VSVKKAKILLVLLTGSLFLIKALYAYFLPAYTLFEVHDIAVNMVNTGEMKYFLNGQFNYNYQFPVYPFLLFLLYKIFGIVSFAGIILNLVLSSLTAIISFSVFRWFLISTEIDSLKTHCNTISLLASSSILLHPLIAYYTICIIHPFALDLLFLFLGFWTMINYFKVNTVWNLLLFGLVFGIAIMDRGTFIVLLIPFFYREFRFSGFVNSAGKTILVFIIGMLVISPWMARNYKIYGELSFNSSFGQNLWLGVQEKTNGTAYLGDGKNTYYSLLAPEEWQKINELDPVQQSNYFFDKYKSTLKESPDLVLKMFFVKLRNFWLLHPNSGSSYSSAVQNLVPVYNTVYLLVLLLSASFIFLVRNKSLILLLFLIFLSLLQAVFYVETRHRIIIEPFLIFMAIAAVFVLINKYRRTANDR
jgi:hypothetical protein